MNEFHIGQIFEVAYPPESAVWCNENSAYITEIEPQDGVRRFQIVAVPEPTEEELASKALAAAKAERADAVASITVEVDGMIFDGDEKAQERMARAVTAAIATDESTSATTTWVLHNNTVATVTIRQLAYALRLAGEKQTVLWTVPYESSYTPAEAA